MTSELETNIVSVERIKEYIDEPIEAPAILPNNRPPKDWPQQGYVEVDSYSVRYRPGLDLVLKSITCQAKPSEKVHKSSSPKVLLQIAPVADLDLVTALRLRDNRKI